MAALSGAAQLARALAETCGVVPGVSDPAVARFTLHEWCTHPDFYIPAHYDEHALLRAHVNTLFHGTLARDLHHARGTILMQSDSMARYISLSPLEVSDLRRMRHMAHTYIDATKRFMTSPLHDAYDFLVALVRLSPPREQERVALFEPALRLFYATIATNGAHEHNLELQDDVTRLLAACARGTAAPDAIWRHLEQCAGVNMVSSAHAGVLVSMSRDHDSAFMRLMIAYAREVVASERMLTTSRVSRVMFATDFRTFKVYGVTLSSAILVSELASVDLTAGNEEALVRLFAALRSTLWELRRSLDTPLVAPATCFPYVTSSDGLAWNYVAHTGRDTYVAVLQDGSRTVLITFTRSHARECQDALAEFGLAPQCLLVNTAVCSPWILVVTEHCCDYVPLHVELSNGDGRLIDGAVVFKLHEILTALRCAGLVLGNIHVSNMLVRRDAHGLTLKHSNFEVGGAVGVARFPLHLPTHITWPRDAPGRLITYEDDEFMALMLESTMNTRTEPPTVLLYTAGRS